MHINHQYQSRICHEENENSQNRLVFNTIQSNVSFFPQMRPEKKGPELTEDEKHIIEILKVNEGIQIGDLKEKSGLSGKKWDAASKGLSKHGLMKVVVDGDAKIVEYLGK
ncbi:hypothetical protein [Flavobacterium macrobrachii]|uniref:hypothetical protein n=1 Tax=Flavobacterium macrobrachii TaxID=591204 RepID=UPI001EF35F27|nr:hypothetical protein [Flavobacterium macrobrachii]